MKIKPIRGYLVDDQNTADFTVYTEAAWCDFLKVLRSEKMQVIETSMINALDNIDKLIGIVNDILSRPDSCFQENTPNSKVCNVPMNSSLYDLLIEVCPKALKSNDLASAYDFYVILSSVDYDILDMLSAKRKESVLYYTKLKDKVKDFTPDHTVSTIMVED